MYVFFHSLSLEQFLLYKGKLDLNWHKISLWLIWYYNTLDYNTTNMVHKGCIQPTNWKLKYKYNTENEIKT